MKNWNETTTASRLVRDLVAGTPEDKQERLLNMVVGGDIGFTVGDVLTIKAFEVRKVTGTGVKYPVAVCEVNGAAKDVSLKQLMGLASLRGYSADNTKTFPHEFDDENGVKCTLEYSPNVSKDHEKCLDWQPKTRNYLDFLNSVETELPKGTTVTFLGTVVRPYKARRGSGNGAFEQWRAGYNRCITQNLWLVKKPEGN